MYILDFFAKCLRTIKVVKDKTKLVFLENFNMDIKNTECSDGFKFIAVVVKILIRKLLGNIVR